MEVEAIRPVEEVEPLDGPPRETLLELEAAGFLGESGFSAISGESEDPRPTRKAAPQLTAQAAANSPVFEFMM